MVKYPVVRFFISFAPKVGDDQVQRSGRHFGFKPIWSQIEFSSNKDAWMVSSMEASAFFLSLTNCSRRSFSASAGNHCSTTLRRLRT